MSLSYKLPNFAECWSRDTSVQNISHNYARWDHWVMDVLLCNGVGIEVTQSILLLKEVNSFCVQVGIWICKYLEVIWTI